MGLYSILSTGVSGMGAQSNKLSTIADNVANSSTVGYKRATTDFSSLVIDAGSTTTYTSGDVGTTIKHAVSQQGTLSYTSSPTDLAIQGNGFLLVSDTNNVQYLTRAGSFTVDARSGDLVNTGGYTLLGYPVNANGGTGGVVNGTAGLTPVNVSQMNLRAKPSTSGTFLVNLPTNATAATGDTPGSNQADATYTDKSSVVAYDNAGNQVTLDVYLTKTGDHTWEAAVFNQADAASGGGFRYANAPLVSQTLTFDSTGTLTSTPPSLSVPVPNGQTLNLDLTGTTELAADYTPLNVSVNGNAPSTVSGVVIDSTGTVYATYTNGSRAAAFRIPLATVPSPDNMMPVTGNAYLPTAQSGSMQVGFPQQAGRGSLVSGALEQSNVDMASELTDMIVAQRDYTANSKVVQTGADLLDILMNLKA